MAVKREESTERDGAQNNRCDGRVGVSEVARERPATGDNDSTTWSEYQWAVPSSFCWMT